MSTVRLIETPHFLHLDHEGPLDLERCQTRFGQLLQEAHEQGHDLFIDVRDSDAELSMRDVWTLVQHLRTSTPAFDGQIAILDHWDQTYDRMQFLEVSAGEVGLRARAFIDFEQAMHGLWHAEL
ncbi:MAG: hypothetical protein GVY35_04465 [Bacteroidetes bacterium]|jgi:hypothetical protein|nr:hypothetical protein [Bacteroidota bacterium]